MTIHQLKFAPSILARLGEELLPNFDQGIIELVRNAYDADATECKITLSNIKESGGQIKISDNGHGMDENSISNGWLVLGSSAKRGAGTTHNGRVQVGDKGLGRLAALRMGKVTRLTSRPSISSPKLDNAWTEFDTTLIWKEFDQKSTVDKVDVEINSTPLEVNTLSGTDIEINHLYKKITKPEVERLARSLMLLSNPFEEANDFKLTFECDEYPEYEKLVKEGYLSEAEFILKAQLNNNGEATAELIDWKGDTLWTVTSQDWFTPKKKIKAPIYQAPRAKFELSIFFLDQSSFATRNINKTQVSKWLKALGGVHLYHNNFRVHPYGDEGSDWLDMNLERVNNPTIRPSTNTSIGRVNVFDEHKVLQQKTDRVGFIENHAFSELKRFIKDSLDWYAYKKQKDAEQKKEAEKDADSRNVKDKRKALDSAIRNIKDKKTQTQLKQALKAANIATEKQSRHLKDDLKLYRSLATAGTTTAVFSHEISKPLDEIPVTLASAEKLVEGNCDSSIFTRYKRRTNNILSYLHRLSHFAELQLNLLKKSKRRNGAIDVKAVLSELTTSFKPLLEREHIELVYSEKNLGNPKLNGAPCILEAIVTNCLTNSMRAFQVENFAVDNRIIKINISNQYNVLTIQVDDNGPGITGISAEDIWLPGMTTMENGTGFGLSIVKDSVADLGGSCRVEPFGPLGGASFYFEFELL
jgi:signal transduction histidine kinase